MMMKRYNIMFVDDEISVLEAVKWVFADEPYQFFTFKNPTDALNAIEKTEFAVVLADQRMPEMTGTAFFEKLKEKWPDTTRILVTAHADLEVALDAINLGNVYRLLYKPWPEAELKLAVKSAADYFELRSENRRLYELLQSQNKKLRELNRGLECKVEERTKEIRQNEEKRIKLERQLQQAQKMEAIGTLAGGIAHDFNNILSAIIGYTELATCKVQDRPTILRHLKQVLKASERAKDLVSQILAFSRRCEQEKKPIQIEAHVKEVLKLIRSSLPANIEIRQNIEKNVGHILAEPTQIHQVLMNLCTNAAHAMQDEGGFLDVGLAQVTVDSDHILNLGDKPLKYLKLSVSDTGHGMTKNIMNSIFDPYFTTKKKGEGTGLGLSIVHGIVKSFWGEIIVQSEPEKGSTFDVYFPKVEKENLQELEVDEVLPKGNESILFLDDEPELVALGEQMLDELGYKVDTKTSSLEALELFRLEPYQFDLVITDMTMPQMTGDTLAKEIINIRPDIPIILCTGYSERISDDAARKIGIRQFVMKPIKMRNLANIVRRALDLN